MKAVSNLYVFSTADVADINAKTDLADLSDEALLPCVPHQLAALKHSDLCSIIQTLRERLLAAGWGPSNLDAMEQEHHSLAGAVPEKLAPRAVISASNEDESFDVC